MQDLPGSMHDPASSILIAQDPNKICGIKTRCSEFNVQLTKVQKYSGKCKKRSGGSLMRSGEFKTCLPSFTKGYGRFLAPRRNGAKRWRVSTGFFASLRGKISPTWIYELNNQVYGEV